MRPSFADRVGVATTPAVAQTLKRAKELEAEGVQLTYLMRGEPDFDTPAHIVQAAVRALADGQTHYGPVAGIEPLRQAVGQRLLRDFDHRVSPEKEIIITTGATMGLFIAIMALINPNDEVIIFDPVYDPYPSIVRMAGGIPVRVAAEQQVGHFSVPIDLLQEALTPRTKVVLLNNPWNPTGAVMTRAELEELVAFAEEHDLFLIVDEIYENLVYGRRHHHLAALSPQARSRTVTVNSLSKTYAMTGWRIGYNVAPAAVTEAMLRIAQQFSRSAATFIQVAAVDALAGPQDRALEMRNTYKNRRELVTRHLHSLTRLNYFPPEGTFFSLLDVRAFGMSSQEMAEYLLQEAQVVLIPGSAYGSAGEGYVRLSFAYADETLERGLSAIAKALNKR